MGGGHFAVVLPAAVAESYCERVGKVWRSNLERLYESVGELKAYNDALHGDDPAKRDALLDVLFCLAPCERKDGMSAKDLFEIVTKIRHNALEKNKGGIYRDRRS
jgi:hypothetical protein